MGECTRTRAPSAEKRPFSELTGGYFDDFAFPHLRCHTDTSKGPTPKC